MDKQIKVVKRNTGTPKCKYNGECYVIKEKAGDTIRIANDNTEFCILASDVTPTNREGRELING